MASLLVLCFFPAFTPATSGGELRLGRLYRAVSSFHDVEHGGHQQTSAPVSKRSSTRQDSRNIEFRKTICGATPTQLWREQGVQGDLSGLAFALAVSDPACRLRELARKLSKAADFVVHEFPYSEPIFNDGCPCPEIYNSHNFESSLLSSCAARRRVRGCAIKNSCDSSKIWSHGPDWFFPPRGWMPKKFRLFFDARPSKLAVCPNGLDDDELQKIAESRPRWDSSRSGRPKLGLRRVRATIQMWRRQDSSFNWHTNFAECDIVLAGGMCGALSDDTIPSECRVVWAF